MFGYVWTDGIMTPKNIYIPPGISKAMEIDFVRVYELKVTVAAGISWGEMDSDSFFRRECWNFTGKVLEEWQIVMFDHMI